MASPRNDRAARLIWACAEICADLRYAVGMTAPDPFLWLAVGERQFLVVNELEIGRALREAHPGIAAMTRRQAAATWGIAGRKPPTTAALIVAAARHFHRRSWTVPDDFPFGLARQLEAAGLRLKSTAPFFPERRHKSADELAHLRQGVKLAETGLARAREILLQAQIRRDLTLAWDGDTLTAERLRAEIDLAIMRRGGRCSSTIVAPGIQGADPHEAGHGPIRAHEPIVLDIFPRDAASGYHGDLTRTVVKGRASDIVRRAHAAVRAAQRAAVAMARPGTPLREIHRAVSNTLQAHGFATDLTARPPHGFIHGTGHGLGLDIHEPPRIAHVTGVLERGDVVTVEPGLYYPEWGGMRLEDDLAIGDAEGIILNRCPYTLEIP